MRLVPRSARWFFLASACAGMLFASTALAAGNSVLTGTIIDAASRVPVANAVVTITSPALQGEQIVVTDAVGNYRAMQLPPGEYTVRVDDGAHQPLSRSGLTLRTNSTIRLNLAVMPDNLVMEVEVAAKPPTVDIGSATTGLIVDTEMSHRLAVAPAGTRASAVRSFESLGALAPGAHADATGVAFSGSTTGENRFQIDGISVGSATYGNNDMQLSLEFVKEVNIATGAYMPEYGRATGGVFDVVTKSGGNEFHGSVFGTFTPGTFEGRRSPVRAEGTVVAVDQKLGALRDFGFEVGGPIKKDKLWFFAGLNIAMQDIDVNRSLNRLKYETNPDGTLVLDGSGNPIRLRDEYGFLQSDPIPGQSQRYIASKETLQYIGKLTWLINPSHTLTLSVIGSPWWSGGQGRISIWESTGSMTTANTELLEGQYQAFARKESAVMNTASLKLSSSFLDKKLLLDATVGYHQHFSNMLPTDGVGIGSGQGLERLPGISWTRGAPPHTISDFENLPAGSGCEPKGATTVNYCPVRGYLTGGPGNINETTQNRWQGRAVLTYLAKALGQHVIKAGIDLEVSDSTYARANSGDVWFQETYAGDSWNVWRIGTLTSPNEVYVPKLQSATSYATVFGAFVQDSFTFLDRVTINAGLRYDGQTMSSSEGVGMVLPSQWSPRIGAIYDPTGQGRSKVFASYSRYYQNIPLSLANWLFTQRPFTVSVVPKTICNPEDPATLAACADAKNGLPIGAPYSPNRQWGFYYGDRAPVDPELEAQSMSEIVAGGEYEIFGDARVGVNYTHRSLDQLIAPMSRDEGNSYFIGNPGYGAAADFPKSRRDYDALTLFFQKSFSQGWLAQASYTASYLRGNTSGGGSGLLGVDLLSRTINNDGALPGDRRHSVKLFGAKEFVLPKNIRVNLGASYTGTSGAPLNAYGSHPYYGQGSVLILPLGSVGNLPWIHSVDSNVAVGYKISKNSTLSLSLDVFNLFNLQTESSRDEVYTRANVTPLEGGTASDLPAKGEAACSGAGDCRYKLVKYEDGSPFDPADRNPNYGNPTSYQNPRTVRMGVRLTF